jgi:hypothetical protein
LVGRGIAERVTDLVIEDFETKALKESEAST